MYNPGGALWGYLFLIAFFLFVIPSIIISPEMFPQYVYYAGMGLCCLCAAYFILSIIFGGKRRSIRHPVACKIVGLFGGILFQLEIWFLLSEDVMIGYFTNSDAKIDGNGSIFVSIIALFILLVGVIINFVMWQKMKRGVIRGDFKANGRGFLGGWKYRDTFIATVTMICPEILFVSRLAIPMSKIMDVETNELILPFVVIAPLLLTALFFLFAIINVMTLLRIYCIRRFEISTQENNK